MFKKFIFFSFVFFNFGYLDLYSDDKKNIIEELKKIDNFSFNFEQISNSKKERGKCFLVFDNKIKCVYQGNYNKEILINKNNLIIKQKQYDKNYYYPISKSPFFRVLNKDKLIDLIQESRLSQNDEKLIIIFKDKKDQEIKILFNNSNFQLSGWEILDKFQNKIYFSLNIQSINDIYDPDLFKIPKAN